MFLWVYPFLVWFLASWANFIDWEQFDRITRISPIVVATVGIILTLFFSTQVLTAYFIAFLHFGISVAYAIIASHWVDWLIFFMWLFFTVAWLYLACKKLGWNEEVDKLINRTNKIIERENRINQLLRDSYEPYQKERFRDQG